MPGRERRRKAPNIGDERLSLQPYLATRNGGHRLFYLGTINWERSTQTKHADRGYRYNVRERRVHDEPKRKSLREEEGINLQTKGVVRRRSVGEQGDSHKRSAFQLVQQRRRSVKKKQGNHIAVRSRTPAQFASQRLEVFQHSVLH